MNDHLGWLNVYKPINITSFGVLKKIKKKFFFNKIGHAGTLDPLAEGILPVAIGKTTKLIQFISNQIKEYEFEIKWGEQTSTDDREGNIVDSSLNIPNYKDKSIKLKENIPLAINVYLPESNLIDKKLEKISSLISKKTGCLTFFGYGPRYLHSTGQLQKGGPENIHTLFIIENKEEINNQTKSKIEKQLTNLFYIQPEVDIISLKNLGRKVSIIDINSDHENELDEVINIVNNSKTRNKV